MSLDVQAFKQKQREQWASFGSIASQTIPAAARLVRFASVREGDRVLDVGSGTGNVAITAAREGAKVVGSDLTPELLAEAKLNAEHAGIPAIEWREADAEALPFDDATFDVVLSQFGHMFAPRPEVAAAEMLRVLKPGGRIAFSTWPASSLPGVMFGFVAKHVPPPAGVPPVVQWGDPAIVRERLGEARVRDVRFERGSFYIPALGPAYLRALQEKGIGPFTRVIQSLAHDGAKLAAARQEYEGLMAPFFDGNEARHDFLMTRATKR